MEVKSMSRPLALRLQHRQSEDRGITVRAWVGVY